jgi:nitroimidazol reductase NimA-like FMN-containing flavoprotein (pyridoxamine 5'-phosphate oxidase superfamily)
MATFEGVWSESEAEEFLSEAVVPVRLGCHTPAGELWMLSLWYRYHDGGIECATSAGADVVGFLRANNEVSFEISTNRPPYMGVRGTGVATVTEDGSKALLADLVERYLGSTDNEMGEFLLREEREEVTITVDPSRLYTWDFTPRMRGVVADNPVAKRGEPTSPKYD